ncbi:LacI family DNA-binding transcriptional regulator [Flavicella sediminum]|uniref:LacI family DNA-binding transcriptional regulator n=1 Tax=Flavicella sediminum TaxID=2585141 RepID=UPI00112288B2|nr:LacI family DNA-binding transcriptional regulator [Flavicella sediminum]
MTTKKKITIKDIANVLGLSTSAISKALNNDSRISEKTKIAVRQVAENLNYQPNHLASALRSGKSRLVGVIIPRNNSNFFSSVLEKIEEVLNEKGYNIIITQSNESFEKECKCIESLLFTQVDGIIASMANETTDLSYYEKIKAKGIPLVLFDRGEMELKVDYVGIDDYKTSFKIIDHLVAQGCKRIAHMGGFDGTRVYGNRIKGYKDALTKNEIAIDKTIISNSKLRIEDGRKIMEELLELPNRPDAVYAAGDFAALGALQVLNENKIKVPEEISLVGFSNERFTSYVVPAISTVDQNSAEIGKLAAEAFLNRIDNPIEEGGVNKIIIETELLIRDSSNKNK